MNNIIYFCKVSIVACLIVATSSGCRPREGKVNRAFDKITISPYGIKDMRSWIEYLRAVYDRDGVTGLDAARKQLAANVDKLTEPLYKHEVPLRTLGIEAPFRQKAYDKEREFFEEIRFLAKEIERREGQSYTIWDRLGNMLYSYSFGNGPVDTESDTFRVVELYKHIAQPDDVPADVGDLSAWVQCLRKAYDSGGLVRFQETRRVLNNATIDYHKNGSHAAAYYLLRLGHPLDGPNYDNASELMFLGSEIERRQGAAIAFWNRLHMQLKSLEDQKEDSMDIEIVNQLLALYNDIASDNQH